MAEVLSCLHLSGDAPVSKAKQQKLGALLNEFDKDLRRENERLGTQILRIEGQRGAV